jgi:hypothetical protein
LPDDDSRRWVLSYLPSESRSSSSFASSRGLSRTGHAFQLCIFRRQIDYDSRNFVTSPLFLLSRIVDLSSFSTFLLHFRLVADVWHQAFSSIVLIERPSIIELNIE